MIIREVERINKEKKRASPLRGSPRAREQAGKAACHYIRRRRRENVSRCFHFFERKMILGIDNTLNC